MRYVLSGVVAVLVLCGAYYAGYRNGERRASAVSTRPVRGESGESERVAPAAAHLQPTALNSISREDYDALMARGLALPIEGLGASQIKDTFNEGRAEGKRHEATDIMAERGTPVHAVQDGLIIKLFLSKAGGNTIYEFDPDGVYCFYYAHLDHYAEGLSEGMNVKKGDVIGYVGSTGDASPEAPHLHFAIYKLGPEKRWWQGTAINPYPVLVQLARK
jgi:murein DD-endopeptidase MepM/ murein hydrolase activator NlpD